MVINYSSLAILIEALNQTKEQTLAMFDLSEDELNKRYAPGKWNNRQLLHHLVDAETVLYDRIRRVISNPDQVIWAFAQDKWAQELDYESLPLALNRPIYEAVRTSVIHLAERYYESKGHHGFVHNQTGSRTLKDEFDKIAWHNQHHLNQIKQALSS